MNATVGDGILLADEGHELKSATEPICFRCQYRDSRGERRKTISEMMTYSAAESLMSSTLYS